MFSGMIFIACLFFVVFIAIAWILITTINLLRILKFWSDIRLMLLLNNSKKRI